MVFNSLVIKYVYTSVIYIKFPTFNPVGVIRCCHLLPPTLLGAIYISALRAKIHPRHFKLLVACENRLSFAAYSVICISCNAVAKFQRI